MLVLRRVLITSYLIISSSAFADEPILIRPDIIKLISNGTVDVAYFPCSEQGEFPPNWTKELTFVNTPESICVRWSKKNPTEWAQWELYKITGEGGNQKIASNSLPASFQTATEAVFQIPLRPKLPDLNTTNSKQKYRVELKSKNKQSDQVILSALPARLSHLPKPPPANPYACTSAPTNSTRKVIIEIPKMTVNSTSSTSGDGDRDELYIQIGRLGPSTQSTQKRLPGSDDYFEAKNGKTVNINDWTNQNETHINHPVFWSGTLKENESTLLGITAMEQDNADLKDIKQGIVTAMHAVAATATAVGGAYGAVIAAVAESIAVGSEVFIPKTDKHDFVGFVALKVTNRCGYIQTAWTTFSSQNTTAGKVSNQFIDVNSLENIESRLAVLDTNPQFWPDGVNWGPYAYENKFDQFWWIANGTSDSKYTFLLKATSEAP